MSEIIQIEISKINAKQDYMMRDSLDKDLVQLYSDNWESIEKSAPITVFDTPDGLILADGFHRLAAARLLDKKNISADVRKGLAEDAYAYACIANLKHGKPLTRDERRNAISEFVKARVKWSDPRIAEEVGVSGETIRRIRKKLEFDGVIKPQETRIGKDERVIDITDIGTTTNVEVETEEQKKDRQYEKWFNEHVLTGDALELMPTLKKKYDLAIIDPPYGITDKNWDLTNKLELLAFTRQWLTKLLPLMKSSGRLFIFWSRKYMFELKPILDEIQEIYSIEFGGMIVWHFRNVGSMPDNTKRYKLAWEPIFYYYGKEAEPLNFTKTEVSDQKWEGEKQWDVWTYAIPQSNFGDVRIHPTQKPLDLYKQIIDSASHANDTIIDCFAGSGTTGHAALLTGRDFLLIEKDSDYIQIIEKRLKPIWKQQEMKNNE